MKNSLPNSLPDGSRMRYDVLALSPTTSCVTQWPELADVFDGAPDPLVRYVLLMTDPNGPCLKIGDVPTRKQRALLWAGCDEATSLNVLLGRHQPALELTVAWLKSQGTAALDLATFLAEFEKYHQDLKRLHLSIGESGASSLLANNDLKDDAVLRAHVSREDLAAKLPNARARIKALADALFKGDADVEGYAIKADAHTGRVERFTAGEKFAQ